MKIRITFSAIGVLFGVHQKTASRIFHPSLGHLLQSCKNFVQWPSRLTVQATMPDCFKESYKNCKVIIDCTEIRTEQPRKVAQRIYLYSHYKKGFTVKYLIGCVPSGYIYSLSKAFRGRSTDAQITNSSGLLNLLEPGDVVLPDKGFPEIQATLNESGKGILLVMPPFLRGGHFSADEIMETKKISSILEFTLKGLSNT